MLNSRLKLNQDVFLKDEKTRSSRDGFGLGILELAKKNNSVVTLGADLSDSVKLKDFINKYPDRFIQVGIAVLTCPKD